MKIRPCCLKLECDVPLKSLYFSLLPRHSPGFQQQAVLAFHCSVCIGQVSYENFIFRNITLCSPLKVKALLAAYFMLVYCFSYFSSLKMEATCFSKTSFYFQRIIRYYIPESRRFFFHYFNLYVTTRRQWNDCKVISTFYVQFPVNIPTVLSMIPSSELNRLKYIQVIWHMYKTNREVHLWI
jgi:hypothetical protein